MRVQGHFHVTKVVIIPSDHSHRILQPHFSRLQRENNVFYPLQNWKSEKMAKMLIMGPICSIRSGGGAGSRQISPFLTSESDSTGRKPWNMFNGIACDIPLTFWAQLIDGVKVNLYIQIYQHFIKMVGKPSINILCQMALTYRNI